MKSIFHELIFTLASLISILVGLAAVYGVICAAQVLDTNGYGFCALVLIGCAFVLVEIIVLLFIGRWADA